jgi:hypothetical protein
VAVKGGVKTAGKQEVLKVGRPMVGHNHPVSMDWVSSLAKHLREMGLSRWFEQRRAEDPLESRRRGGAGRFFFHQGLSPLGMGV